MKRWPTQPLAELTSIVTKGTTPQTLGRQYTAEGVPFLRAENLQGGRVVVDADTLRIAPETHGVLARSVIRPNDVLLSIAGTIGRAAIVSRDAPEMNCNQAVAIVRLNLAQILPSFLLLWLKSACAQSQMSGAQVTQTISNLSLGCIKQLQMPVPPLAEQERIVKLLDEAAELRKLRAQADRRTAALLPALFHEMFGDPAANPKGWPEVRLVEVTSPKQWPTITQQQLTESGFPVYGANGRIGFYSEFNHGQETVLVTCRGATCGTINVCEPQSYVTGNAMSLDDPRPELLTVPFLEWVLRVRGVQDTITGSAQPQITRQSLSRVSFPAPPLPLQKEFAQRVLEIREMESAQAASRLRLENLFQSLLHRAFNGEL